MMGVGALALLCHKFEIRRQYTTGQVMVPYKAAFKSQYSYPYYHAVLRSYSTRFV